MDYCIVAVPGYAWPALNGDTRPSVAQRCHADFLSLDTYLRSHLRLLRVAP